MSFTSLNIPVLETERLILRGWRADDVDDFFGIYADPDHARFVTPIANKAKAFEKMASFIGHWHLRGWGRFAVEMKSTGYVIGHCGANQLDAAVEPELNYSFASAYAGQGYATEATCAALRYFYETCGWTTAVSEINALNARSQALATRMGAVKETERDTGEFGVLEVWRHLPRDQFLARFEVAA